MSMPRAFASLAHVAIACTLVSKAEATPIAWPLRCAICSSSLSFLHDRPAVEIGIDLQVGPGKGNGKLPGKLACERLCGGSVVEEEQAAPGRRRA